MAWVGFVGAIFLAAGISLHRASGLIAPGVILLVVLLNAAITQQPPPALVISAAAVCLVLIGTGIGIIRSPKG